MTAYRGTVLKIVEDELLLPLQRASPDKPYVIAQLGQSLDGRIATVSGESRWINGPAALDHVHRLRANVDAVVVGVGTALADDPLLTVRRVKGRDPARVVIDPRGRLGGAARCFARDGTSCVLVHGDGAEVPTGVHSLMLPLNGRLMAPSDIVAALFNLGHKRILIEGGAKTVSNFVAAGVIDRLHVLVAPVILGSGIPGLSLPEITHLTEARRPAVAIHVLDGGDVLFDCDLRQQS